MTIKHRFINWFDAPPTMDEGYNSEKGRGDGMGQVDSDVFMAGMRNLSEAMVDMAIHDLRIARDPERARELLDGIDANYWTRHDDDCEYGVSLKDVAAVLEFESPSELAGYIWQRV